MKNYITSKSAYGGKNFSPRNSTKLKSGLDRWQSFHCEYSKLKAVVLYIPGKELHLQKSPDKILHLEKINSLKLKNELKAIAQFYQKEKIKVIDISTFKNICPPPNLCFARDLFWAGPNGVIISRMGSLIRSEEELFIQKTFGDHMIPINGRLTHSATFEGADLLWLNTTTLLLGIGNRTNLAALKQLKFYNSGVKIIPILLPKKVQHLLGLIQFIDQKKVLLRTAIAPKKLIRILKEYKYKIIEIPEINEVIKLQGMNIVTITPNSIIMPDDCPILEGIYLENKIKVLKKFKIEELRKAAGGLACLTGILQRIN